MRFVIICPARTGSTMLRKALLGRRDIACHGEIMGLARPHGLIRRDTTLEKDEAWRLHAEDPIELIRHAFGKSAVSGRTVFGFKMIYRQFEGRPDVADWLAADREIALVHLWRRDLCERFMSHERYAAATKPGAEPHAITLDPAAMIVDIARQRASREKVLAHFEGHRVLEPVYEDLLAAGNATVVSRFLGVEGDTPLPEAKADRDDLPEITVANAAELRAAYAAL